MPTEYRVISDWRCLTAGHKAKKIERQLNNLSAEGWEFVALDSMTVLGFDLGFYLVLKRVSTSAAARVHYLRPDREMSANVES